MFTPVAMQHITLKTLVSAAPQAAAILAEFAMFAPTAAFLPTAALLPDAAEVPALPARPGAEYQRVFRDAQARLEKIQRALALPSMPAVAVQAQAVALPELAACAQRLGEIWGECSALEERMHTLREQAKHVETLLNMLEIFSGLDIDLRRLQPGGQFLEPRLGTLPVRELARFQRAVAMEPYHFMQVFHTRHDTAYVMIAAPPHPVRDAGKLLQAADFHPLVLPPEFDAPPQSLRQQFSAQQQANAVAQDAAHAELRSLSAQRAEEVRALAELLRQAWPFAALADTLCSGQWLAVQEGWVPAREVERLRTMLTQQLAAPFDLTVTAPEAASGAPPTLLEHAKFFKPFEHLVKNFGVPGYSEIDPTVLLAISALLMFGMMFGDVGHGAVIVLAGWLWRRKLGEFTALVMASGAMSMIFGVLYGSVFGYEDLFPALWMSPMHNPMRILGVALAWGAGFILLACLLKLRNLITARRYGEALFHLHGVAGIALYIAGIAVAWRMATGLRFTSWDAVALAAPLAVAMAYQWHELRATPWAERAIIVVIEGLDGVINFVSNTLSFMRVAAFSLNHAALAVAVFTVAQSMDGFGHWTAVILGNIFILAMEGAIVAIQVLRLEYYEGFVRFFSGNGRAFMPLRTPLNF